LFNLIS